jgi:poly(A) polymerase Pap1
MQNKSPPLDRINEDVIYNRLPKNFFVQEEETKDLESVLSSIKQMRQDFIGYVSESNIQ